MDQEEVEMLVRSKKGQRESVKPESWKEKRLCQREGCLN